MPNDSMGGGGSTEFLLFAQDEGSLASSIRNDFTPLRRQLLSAWDRTHPILPSER